MNEPKFTPGYEVTPDGRVFSVVSNWRGYGCRAPDVVADQGNGVNNEFL